MTEIFEKILQLESDDRSIQLKMIHDDPETRDQYYRLLLAQKTEDLNNYIDSFQDEYGSYLREELKGFTPAGNRDLPEAEDAVRRTLARLEEKKRDMEFHTARAKEISLSGREVMKSAFGNYPEHYTDQMKGILPPPLSGTAGVDKRIIELPDHDGLSLAVSDIRQCIASRRSRRKFTGEPLSLVELSYLLWATQGVRKTFIHNIHALRTVPSGGARHPFETYLAANNVTGLEPGIYRYLSLSDSLELIGKPEGMKDRLTAAALDQGFVGNSSVCFIWTAVPYRTEWRYTVKSNKIILQDSGHLCQNLYLACESINCGTCAIGAYDQELSDALLGVDGIDEFTVYMAPVGKN